MDNTMLEFADVTTSIKENGDLIFHCGSVEHAKEILIQIIDFQKGISYDN